MRSKKPVQKMGGDNKILEKHKIKAIHEFI